MAFTAHALVAPSTQHQRLAPTNAVADFLLRDAKPDIRTAEGDAVKENKVNTPDSAKRIFALPTAPKRVEESPERVEEVRARARTAAADAAALAGMLVGDADQTAWWRSFSAARRRGRVNGI